MNQETGQIWDIFSPVLLIAIYFSLFFGACTRSPVKASPYRLLRLLSDTPHSVWLLCTSDQPDAGTLPKNAQHSKENIFHAPVGIRSNNPTKRATAHALLRPRGNRDRQHIILLALILSWSKKRK